MCVCVCETKRPRLDPIFTVAWQIFGQNENGNEKRAGERGRRTQQQNHLATLQPSAHIFICAIWSHTGWTLFVMINHGLFCYHIKSPFNSFSFYLRITTTTSPRALHCIYSNQNLLPIHMNFICLSFFAPVLVLVLVI